MGRKKQEIAAAIAEARAEAQPGSYSQRYQFSLDNGGQVVPKGLPGDIPRALANVRFTRNSENELEATSPELAVGTIGMIPGIMSAQWDVNQMADWDAAYIPNDGKQDMRSARRWWRWDPLTFRCVKVLTQLSNAKLTVGCENDDFKEIVENWIKKAMPASFRKQWYLEYFRSAMVPVLKTLIPYKPRDYKDGKTPQTKGGRVEAPMERATGSENVEDHDKAVAEATQRALDKQGETLSAYSTAMAAYKIAIEMSAQGLCSKERLDKLEAAAAIQQNKWLAGNIAGSYTILDPLDVDMDGPPEMAWLRQPYLKIGGSFVTAIRDPKPEQAEMIAKMPIDIVRAIKEGGTTKIWLSPNICTVTFGEKQPYERYPTPIVIHADEALKLKIMLYQMDKAVAKSVRDKILKVTVGNDEYPAFDPAQIQAIAAIFNNPSRNLTIFWNHTLECEWIEPKDTSLGDEKKYSHVNNEIRTAFGICATITGTGSDAGAVGDGLLNMKGLEEEVGEAQDTFLEWANAEIELLKQALQVSFKVTLTSDKMNLRDPEKFMALLLQLYQGGVIDAETAVTTMGFNFPEVSKRMENIIKLRKKGLFMPIPSANNLGPDGMLLPQKNGAASPPGGGIRGKGRPAGQPKKANQQKRGTSQPKRAKAQLIPGVEGVASYLVLDRQLTQEERASAAERFSIPVEWVLTEAEYKANTGRTVDWLPPLPQLTTGELFNVLKRAEQAVAEIDGKVEAMVEKYRAGKPGGVRGAYITAKMREDFEAEAVGEVLKPMIPAVSVDEWDKRLAKAVVEIADLDLKDQRAKDVHAVCLLAAKYQKLSAAVKAPIVPVAV